MIQDPRIASVLTPLREVVEFNGTDDLYIRDHKRFREKFLDDLVLAAFSQTDPKSRTFLYWLIRRLALSSGIVPASMKGLYAIKREKKIPKACFPSFSFPELTYEKGRELFLAANQASTRAFLLELVLDENTSLANFESFSTIALASALREGYTGPLFLQAGCFSIKNIQDLEVLKGILINALQVGFYNLELDTSGLRNLEAVTMEEQFRPCSTTAVQLAEFVFSSSPNEISPALSFGVGATNLQNTTLDDLRVFMDEVRSIVSKIATITIYDRRLDIRTIESWTNLLQSSYGISGVRLLRAGQTDPNETDLKSLESYAHAEVAQVCLPPNPKWSETFSALNVSNTFDLVTEAIEAPKIAFPLPEGFNVDR